MWLVVLALVGAVTFLALPGLPSKASGHATLVVSEGATCGPVTLAVSEGATSDPQAWRAAGVIETPPCDVGQDKQVTGSPAPAIFLPLVLNGHPQAPESSFGVALNWFRQRGDKVLPLGASWIRTWLLWSWIEPENTRPENYQWPAWLDEEIAQLSAHGIRPILTIQGNPSWAATYPGGPVDLVELGELVEFMEAAVARYSAPPYNVKHWEFYNEPDNTSELYAQTGGWGYFGHQPEAYVELLAAVYGPMKAVDPEAQIVFGGLALDNWTTDDPPGNFARDFVDKVLQNGGGAYFDVMNFHYYIAFRHNWDPHGPGIIGKATALREKLASYGVYKPLICTETSMWSDALHGGSDELQCRYVPQVFARSMAAGLQTTIWYRLVEGGTVGDWKYGLMDSDVNPKPSYRAYQTMVRQLAPTRYVRTLDPGETSSDQIEAYEFDTHDGSTRILVAWTNDELAHALVLETAQVVVVDKFGSKTTIDDGGDGTADGRVWVDIGPSPVYLRFQP